MAKATVHPIGRARAGFTLIEVLLVMLITSILVLGVNGAYRQAHLLWNEVEAARPVYQACRQVIECLRTELSGLYMPPCATQDEPEKTFVLTWDADGSIDLVFHTLSPGWRGSAALARGTRVRYRFVKGESAQGAVLERFEQPCAGELVVGQEAGDTLLKGAFEFGAWVIDPNSRPSDRAFETSYVSSRRPPQAVKVRLQWPLGKRPGMTVFEALIDVPCEDRVEGESTGPSARAVGRVVTRSA